MSTGTTELAAQRNARLLAAALVLGGLILASAMALLLILFISSSSDTKASTVKELPATVGDADPVTGFKPVTLTEKAAERIGIQTVAVAAAGAVREGSSGSLAVPYSAIWYDAKGNASVYTVTAPLAYVRAAITVAYVEGDQAILSAGPSVGAEIVSRGVAELYGAETGLK